MGVSVGVDVGGTKIVAGVPGPDGRLLDREDRATPDRASAPILVEGLIADAVETLRARHDVRAVGVAAAGFVDAAGARVRFAPHLAGATSRCGTGSVPGWGCRSWSPTTQTPRSGARHASVPPGARTTC